MVGFDDRTETSRMLDGKAVNVIHSDLTARDSADVTTAKLLTENADICFLGIMKAGSFDIDESVAVEMLRSPNPNGSVSSDVLRPRLTARDILQRAEVGWVIDLGTDATKEQAALFELPWKHLETNVKPVRLGNRRKRLAEKWWIHGESRPGLRRVLTGLTRFIVTPEVSKHRVFVWLDGVFLADHQTRAFAKQDDHSFGVLHSRIHEIWARSQGTQLRERESGFRYTPTTCFETFPFPTATPDQQAAIAAAAKELDALRTNWLNPPEWTRQEVLEFPGSTTGPWSRYVHDPNERGIGTVRYPRLVAKDADCAKKLQKRTLTNLYNERPTWLDLAHKKLDAAVAAAYGWPADLAEEEILARLLKLNWERAGAEKRTQAKETAS